MRCAALPLCGEREGRGKRISAQDEEVGVDVAEHGEKLLGDKEVEGGGEASTTKASPAGVRSSAV